MENKKGKIVETLAKPAFVGVVGALGARVLLGEDGDLVLFGKALLGWLGIGGTVMLGSYIGEVSHEWLLPLIPKNEKYASLEGAVLSPVICGLSVYGIMKVGNVVDPEFIRTFALGAGSEVAGDYAYNAVVSPWVKKNLE